MRFLLGVIAGCAWAMTVCFITVPAKSESNLTSIHVTGSAEYQINGKHVLQVFIIRDSDGRKFVINNNLKIEPRLLQPWRGYRAC
jgi:hypothetical protein